ncbi:late histone H2A.1-like [Brevipalpus obovatus]|uniref:late histone H2A.1-like n=1 Tax=Brevipalpus obovatus TaxID=246614 RepID=UPI003D9EE01E
MSSPDQESKKSGKKSKSSRCGLQFPVGRISRMMKKHHNAGYRVGVAASIYTAAVLEYLTAEILELAGNAATDNKKNRITPRHMQLAIKNDEELNNLLKDVTLPQAGVLPDINPVLLPNKKMTSASQEDRTIIRSQELASQ